MERNMVSRFSTRSSCIQTNETPDFQVLENYSSAMVPTIRANLLIMKSWDKEHDTLPRLGTLTPDISTTVTDRTIDSPLLNVSRVSRRIAGEMDGHGRLK